MDKEFINVFFWWELRLILGKTIAAGEYWGAKGGTISIVESGSAMVSFQS